MDNASKGSRSGFGFDPVPGATSQDHLQSSTSGLPEPKPTPTIYAANAAIFNVQRDHYSNTTNYYASGSEDPILAEIPYAQGAGFKPEKACFPGTRLSILQTLIDWVENPNGAAILWLTGFAGAGKSAIAHAIALHFHNQGRLGSSFFFDRAHQASRRPDNLFSTIACDVIRLDPTRERSFLDIIRNNRSLRTTNSPYRQLHELLLAPKGSPNVVLPIVVVIDALDESGEREDRAEMLSALQNATVDWSDKFRFLITSRFEEDIAEALLRKPHIDMEQMHDLDRQSTDNDIYQMLSKHLPSIPALDSQYPNDEWRHMLVRKAEGIFQWAATACRLILGSGKRRNPRTQFAALMTAGSQLYSLYLSVLNDIFDDEDENVIIIFRTIIGAVLVAREPLTLNAIEALYPEEDVGFIVAPLGSLLSGTVDGGPITPIHTSFRDFLIDPVHSGTFSVDFLVSNKQMLLSTLQCMNRDLHFNMGDFRSSYSPSALSAPLPTHIVYSCKFWADHLNPLNPENNITENLRSFFLPNFLYWLEVLSLTKSMHLAGSSLTVVATKFAPDEISKFADDARRFVTVFASPISLSTPHIYLSALPFAPAFSAIKEYHQPRFSNTIRVTEGERSNWPILQSVLQGHEKHIKTVIFCPNGSRIVSGSDDHTVRIWDAVLGEQIGDSLIGHTAGVNSVAFCPRGSRIVSGSNDHTIRIWNVTSRKQIGPPLIGHSDSVNSVVFSANGMCIASGSEDTTIRIWNALSGRQIRHPLIGHVRGVNSVAFSSDGSRIISGSRDGLIRIWDTSSGEQVRNALTWHNGVVNSVAFSPDSSWIASGSNDWTIRIWNTSSGKQVGQPLVGHTNYVTSVAFSPNGLRIVSGSHDHTIRIWDASSREQVNEAIIGHLNCVTSVAFSPDSCRVVSGSYDKTIRVWDATSSHSSHGVTPLIGHLDAVTSVALPCDGALVVSGSRDNTVRLWSASSGEQVGHPAFGSGHDRPVTSVAISHDGSRIASGSRDKTVRIWAMAGEQIGQLLIGHTRAVMSVAFSPDGSHVASGSDDGTIRIWNALSGEQVQQLIGHVRSVMSITYSPDGSRISSGSNDRTIRIWDTSSGEQVGQPLIGHNSYVTSVAYSPDASFIVSGSQDNTARIWEVKSGNQIGQPLIGHEDYVTSIAFSSDGSRVASGSRDRNIQVWNASSREKIGQPLVGHDKRVNSIVFSPDGTQIVSGSDDGTIRIWDLTNIDQQNVASDPSKSMPRLR